ncbi:YqgE/AlgH family protein [Mesosutterella sp. AGMB02718]|uniref:UPF0301 protein MUN46_003285 n=1 Tax=Mesosutterella faecium TaxID=2925194 RepID=A0ABT7IKS6_9BURK|nr:YqgE/AlgH family protein [Mesosutterella sp. AGMB02718]MDL2058972.1 YqgE/AlgH family protein [Mesosutterella sp. AGMB02718]
MTEQSLKNNFLVAMPSLRDPNFSQTVVYVLGHDQQGARGVVINRPTGLALSEVLKKTGIRAKEGVEIPDAVYIGGPVQTERGCVLHERARTYMLSEQVTDGLVFTISKDVLEDIAQGRGPAKRLFFLGYAGWEPGQLEAELVAGDWITVEADPAVIFDVPPQQRYEAALKLLGLDMQALQFSSGKAGHA